MSHRIRVIIGVFGILAILLAACAPAASPTAAPAQPAATTAPAATSAAQPAATTAPQPAAATGAVAKPASGEPIKVGIVTGTSGAYASLGQDQVRGGQLAVKEINDAGGVLGRPIQFIDRDDKLNPQEAAKQAEQLISNEKVSMLTGCVSAATELAVNDVAKRANVLFMGTCQSNPINKTPDRGPYTFHMALTPWMNNQMVLPWITQNLGDKIYMLIADYAWGHENLESIDSWLQKNNQELLGSVKAPLGTTDFTSLIPQIRAAQPEVLYVVNAGNDQIAFLKQAQSFGMMNEMKIYNPVVDIPWDRELGFANVAGHYGGMNFYWELQDQLPSAKNFVEAFAKEFNVPPSGYASYQYVALKVYADAVNKAGSLEPDKVAQALEGMEFDYAAGKSFIRACDHQLFQPAHIVVGRSEAEAKDIQPWPQFAFRKIVDSIEPDEKYERTCEELN